MSAINKIDELSINTIRMLSIDAVQKANSGHPGMPMGTAPLGYKLFRNFIKHNPVNPEWWNRDRFVLSAGHGSMLLYSLLHLTGYDVSLEDLKNFRQLGSKTPGHPEYRYTPGVETTTGPLGQGIANAVGMVMAKKYLAAKFNKENYKLFDHKVYVIASDGDLMEGISHEASSIAGHLKLNDLIVFYDNNKITIDGGTDLSFSEDVRKRFEAYGWHVLDIQDVNNLDEVDKIINEAFAEKEKPVFVITKTSIGYGSPNKQDKSSAHGAPLGVDEVKATKRFFGWDEEKEFYVPEEVKENFKVVKDNGEKFESEWNQLFENYKKEFPDDAKLLTNLMNGNYSEILKEKLPEFTEAKLATRVASGKVINSLAEILPTFIGGSADLASSNNTLIKNGGDFSSENYAGKNIYFGIREHAMGSISNGMAYYGGIIPYCATFLIFSDYMRPAIRIAALSELHTIFVFTHDSIGVGEDGPTHQPIEQIASLRAIPNLNVIRPADATETVAAWLFAIENKKSPNALILTRQNLPVLDRTKLAAAENLNKGAYILKDSEGTPDVILIASGSEVHIALEAAEKLDSEGIKVRVVSFPSWQIFEKQSYEYKNSVLIPEVKARVSVEAGIKMGWERYVGEKGISISLEHFGASAPGEILMQKFGFTSEKIIEAAKSILKK